MRDYVWTGGLPHLSRLPHLGSPHPCKQALIVNPLSPNIHTQILQTDVHTSPLRIS